MIHVARRGSVCLDSPWSPCSIMSVGSVLSNIQRWEEKEKERANRWGPWQWRATSHAEVIEGEHQQRRGRGEARATVRRQDKSEPLRHPPTRASISNVHHHTTQSHHRSRGIFS